jgi:peptide/nickel transport system permease protein
MLSYVIRRLLLMIPVLLVISIASFAIIQLPEGDFLDAYMLEQQMMGEEANLAEVEALRIRFGLDKPFLTQYTQWMKGVLTGDFGYSFIYRKPVSSLIWDRVGLSFALSFSAMIFVWLVAFPIGFYSATHQYSFGDHCFTLVGFLGLATPNFILALIFMFISHQFFGQSVGGLFSPEYIEAPWSFAKFFDLLKHIWIPTVVVGTAGTAGTIRITRANLLDELQKPYVITARTKGLSEWRLILKYPVRLALNPFISTVGWMLPALVSGETITSIVLGLPTIGPMLYEGLRMQDMFLAGSLILILSTLTVIGTLISDLLLGVLDPRIRYE